MFKFQLVDKLTTDESISDIQMEYEDVSTHVSNFDNLLNQFFFAARFQFLR